MHKKLFTIVSLVLLLILFSLGMYFSNISHSLIMQGIDDRLIAGACGANLILGETFHDGISDEKSVSYEVHLKNVKSLTALAAKCGLDYLYTMMKPGEKIVFTSTSSTAQDIEKKAFDPFFKEYNTPSENLIKVLASDDNICFEEFQDEYGNFRSVMIPLKSPSGKRYVAGADISVDSIRQKTREANVNIIVICAVFQFIGMAVFYFILSSIFSGAVPPAPEGNKEAPASK